MTSVASPLAPTTAMGTSQGGGGSNSSASHSDALAAFDMPSMPGPYEDFDFSLDLPDNILPSDLDLVTSPEFSQLFGLRSDSTPTGSMAPSSLFGGLRSPGATGLTPTASFSWKSSEPPTPRMSDAHEDTDMVAAASTASTSMDTPSRMQASGSSSGFPIGDIPAEPRTTSMPASANLGSSAVAPLPQPPVAPFSPPPGGGLFDFGDATNPAGMKPQAQQTMSFGPNAPPQPQGLFNASETNFLSNFLSNFEGWDFNPSLPTQMPSFAEAEKNAFQYGIPTPPTPVASNHSDGRRGSRRSLSGASMQTGRSKASPRGQFGSNYPHSNPMYRMDPSASAAFGRPMEEFEADEDEEDDADQVMSDGSRMQPGPGHGKKMKIEHGFPGNNMPIHMHPHYAPMPMHHHPPPMPPHLVHHEDMSGGQSTVPEAEKRQNHILSEQRRRGHIREAFKELVDMLEAGREFGARGLGLSSGAGTGIEDEGLDDRSDYESTLEEEGASAAAKRRKAKAKRRAALEAARRAGASGKAVSAAIVNGSGGRGKGRGRGGSAGGGAGSKSAVLFQAVDLLHWLDGRNSLLSQHVEELESALVEQPKA